MQSQIRQESIHSKQVAPIGSRNVVPIYKDGNYTSHARQDQANVNILGRPGNALRTIQSNFLCIISTQRGLYLCNIIEKGQFKKKQAN